MEKGKPEPTAVDTPNVIDDSPGTDLAAKLNKLFEVMRPAGQAPLSNASAAEAITAATGVSISSAYLWQLRSGLKKNPTIQHLQAIASFFGVPASYLLNTQPVDDIDDQLALLQALRNTGVRNIALRAFGLNSQTLDSLSAIIDQIRAAQHLPPVDELIAQDDEEASHDS